MFQHIVSLRKKRYRKSTLIIVLQRQVFFNLGGFEIFGFGKYNLHVALQGKTIKYSTQKRMHNIDVMQCEHTLRCFFISSYRPHRVSIEIFMVFSCQCINMESTIYFIFVISAFNFGINRKSFHGLLEIII